MDFVDRLKEIFYGQSVFFGNPVRSWLLALGLGIVVFCLLALLKRFLGRGFSVRAAKTSRRVYVLMEGLVPRTKLFFLMMVAVWAGSLLLKLPPQWERLLVGAVILAVVLQGALWANTFVSLWLKALRKEKMQKDPGAVATLGLIGFLSRVGLWAVVVLLVLDNLGIDITALVAGLGIGGVAVALALQNILGDLFASLSILLDRPFVIGDFIIVDELLGTVEQIGIKTTRIRSLSGELIVFSNSDLLGSRIRNFKRMYERRVLFGFGLVYQTSYEKLAAIPGMVREIVEKQPQVHFDRAHFKAYGDSSLDFEVVYFVKNPDYNVYMDTQQAIHLEIFRRFADEGIDFAYPTRTLYVNQVSTAAEAPEPA